jgi:hypothetical protein
MRSSIFAVLSFLPVATVCPPAIGQAVTEYSLGVGRAATTAAPVRNAAGAIAGALENLSKAAGADSSAASSQSSPSSSETRRPAARTTRSRALAKSARPADRPAAAAPAPVYEDPRLIQAGMEYDEMVRRFGPPSMLVTTAPGTSTVWYAGREVEVTNGKVITAPAGASPAAPQ